MRSSRQNGEKNSRSFEKRSHKSKYERNDFLFSSSYLRSIIRSVTTVVARFRKRDLGEGNRGECQSCGTKIGRRKWRQGEEATLLSQKELRPCYFLLIPRFQAASRRNIIRPSCFEPNEVNKAWHTFERVVGCFFQTYTTVHKYSDALQVFSYRHEFHQMYKIM